MEHEDIMWIEFAKTDLGVAEHLDKQYYLKPLEIICYHCQQAVEKAIKAIILYRMVHKAGCRRNTISHFFWSK